MDLGNLIDPVSKGEFFTKYWEKSHLYAPGNGKREFSSVFSLLDLDSALHYLQSSSTVNITGGPGPQNRASSFDTIDNTSWNTIYEKFCKGSTIIVNSLHKTWNPVSRLCANLCSEIGMEVQANLYVTPRNGKGFECHWDGHDVLVLQLNGTKNWDLYPQIDELPRPTHPGDKYVKLVNPIKHVTMKPGDVLYVPRGVPHEAQAGNEASSHLTIGLVATTWEDLMHASVHNLSARNPAMRKSLPFGWSENEKNVSSSMHECRAAVDALLTEQTIQDDIDLLAVQLLQSAPCLPDGHFAQFDLIDHISLDTTVIKRSGNLLRVVKNAQGVTLYHPCGSLAGPDKILWALRFIASKELFKVGDIPGWYSNEERLMLVKRLVRAGFLCVHSPSPEVERDDFNEKAQ